MDAGVTVRNWTYAGAQQRWAGTARAVLPNHVAHPYVDSDGGAVIRCSCGEFDGRGPNWLGHLNESIRLAIKD